MSENNKFVSWVKAHKTELIIAGVSITAIIGIILGIKNKDGNMGNENIRIRRKPCRKTDTSA